MKSIKSVLASLLMASVAGSVTAQVSFGTSTLLNDDWQFAVDINGKNADVTSRDFASWHKVNLPHDWSVKFPLSPSLASCTGFLPGGVGCYVKKFNVEHSQQGQKLYMYFEGVYNRSKVYLNGHLLGYRPNGYASFMYDMTPYINYGSENVLEVVVDHSRSADSRWYTGSGIYRNVWMVEANPIHIAQWGVYAATKSSNASKATVHLSVEVNNETDKAQQLQVVSRLVDRNGKTISTSKSSLKLAAKSNGSTEYDINVLKPHLWSLEDPYMYNVVTTVSAAGKVVDKCVTSTGIRTITFDPNNGMTLNGAPVKLKGVCLHHDAGVLGAAVPKEVWEDRLLTLKEIGCNALRMSHNPQAPAMYELADSLGFLVLDEGFDEWEFAKRKWLQGWNVGTPGFEGSFDFFEEWSSRDIADMVRRDRNHPSIFAWSIGNEVDYPNDPYSHPVLDGSTISQPMFGGYKADSPNAMRLGDIAKRLAAEVRNNDKFRPVTAALAGVVMSNETEYPGALDITGYNYTEDRYDVDHKKYPSRVIFGSENRHDMPAWRAARDNQHILGQFLWTGIDYLGESGPWPQRGFYSGLIGFDGRIKPRGLFRQALWSSKPVISLGTQPVGRRRHESMDAWGIWNYKAGQNIAVMCYTNAATAKLFLNGKQVGETLAYDDNDGIISWDVPYSDGKLEAVGFDKNGNEICRTALVTAGRPVALRASASKSTVSKNRGVAVVHVEIVDAEGNIVPVADDLVTCKVSKNGKLLGLEAGNNTDTSDYTDNEQRAFNGRLTAFVEACGSDETIEVTFSAPWLKDITIPIYAK